MTPDSAAGSRGLGRVATLAEHRPRQGRQHPEQLVGAVAQPRDQVTLGPVGGDLDLLAQVAPGVGERAVAVEQAPVGQPPAGRRDVVGVVAAGPHVAAWLDAPPQL